MEKKAICFYSSTTLHMGCDKQTSCDLGCFRCVIASAVCLVKRTDQTAVWGKRKRLMRRVKIQKNCAALSTPTTFWVGVRNCYSE